MLDAGHGSHGGHGTENVDGGEEETEVKYDVPEDMIKLYKRILRAVPIKEHIQGHKKHMRAHGIALKSLVDVVDREYPQTRNEAEEILADALITYRKEAGLPNVEDRKQRHYVIGDIQRIFNQLEENGKINVQELVKGGKLDELLRILTENEKNTDLGRKVEYEMGKLIPHEKEHTFYQDLIKAHAKTTGAYFSEGDIAGMSNRRGAMNLLKGVYNDKIQDRLNRYKPGGEHADSHEPAHH